MEICRKLAGYSYGRADLVRRAMSKKKLDVMEKERQIFIYGLPEEGIVGAVNNGVSEKAANDIFDEMSNFAKYAFNKSHAAAYAYVSYQTAWLKCHYPCELMAATLTSVLDSSSKVSTYIAECTRIGIKVLAPNINSSFEGFTVNGNSIRFGLLAIKNLGKGFIRTIIENREANGRFATFSSFCKRTHSKEFNKRAVESLIKCGACDGMDLNRRQMIHMLPQICEQIDSDKNRNFVGQIGFFDEDSGFNFSNEIVAPDLPEMPLSELLSYEKATTGLYISGHPMDEFRELGEKLKADKITDILSENGSYADNGRVKIYGIISRIEKKNTKNNQVMCFIDVEDITSSIECIVFSKLYADKIHLLSVGTIVLIEGRLSMREDREPSVICELIMPNPKNLSKEEEPKKKNQRKGLFLRVESSTSEANRKISLLREIFEGNYPLYIYYEDTGKYVPSGFVDVNEPMLSELRGLLGEDNVVMR